MEVGNYTPVVDIKITDYTPIGDMEVINGQDREGRTPNFASRY